MPYEVLLYYLYREFPDPEAAMAWQRELCESLGLRGRIIVGPEGINGTVSGPADAAASYRRALEESPMTSGIEFKIDSVEGHVFPKLSVKVRTELVTLGLDSGEDVDPSQVTGARLSPREFHDAMKEEGVLILDARNRCETDLGKFAGAVCPEVEHFRDFPAWIREHLAEAKDRKILTYCTGGIRCEKLSGFLLEEGFHDVAQLDGGIVRYSQDDETRGDGFEGLCYVFDERVGIEVNFTGSRSVISRCRYCGEGSSRYRNCALPECNAQFFCCGACEEKKGRFCSGKCSELIGHQ